jgi:hypothetical protein
VNVWTNLARRLRRPFAMGTQLHTDARAEIVSASNLLTNLECLGEAPPCWDLLRDPVGVLTDKQRWPSHFCDDFFHVSKKIWLHSAVAPEVVDIFPFRLFSQPYPLYIGRGYWEQVRKDGGP